MVSLRRLVANEVRQTIVNHHETFSRLMIVFAVFLLSTDAVASRADALLDQQLERAATAQGSYAITYDFRVDLSALGHDEAQQWAIHSGSALGQSFVTIGGPEAARVDFRLGQFCRQVDSAWHCEQLTPAQRDASASSPHMRLFPPTAMRLLRHFLQTNASATIVSAHGIKTVADRTCDAYHVAIDTAVADRAAVNLALYLDIESDATVPFVSGLHLDLCFDQVTGQVLAYQNLLTLDQQAMAQAGLADTGDALRQPTGQIAAELMALQTK